MQLKSFLLVLASVNATMSNLDFDYFYRQCQAGTTPNGAVKAHCKGQGGRQAIACGCKQDIWLDSMYACFKVAADSANVSESAVRGSYSYLINRCTGRLNIKVPPYETVRDRVETNFPTISYKEANETKVGPFLPNMKLLAPKFLELSLEKHYQYYWAEMFGMITVWYLAGIMFLQMIFHWSAYLVPGFIRVISNNPLSRQLRRHIVLPATFNKYRATPIKVMRWLLLCIPPRLHVVYFAGYLFLSIFFLAFHYPNITDPSWYDSYKQLVSAYLAYRSGQLGMYKMPFVFLFAGRNNILIWLTGWQFEIFNHWHRWIGRLFAVDIAIHSIAYTVDLGTEGEIASEYKRNFMIWGAVGTICACLLCGQGTKTLRQWCYEFFLYLHIILAVFCVVGTYYHLVGLIGIKNTYAVIAIWGFDRVARVARIIHSGPFSKAHIKAHPGGTLEITVNYSELLKPRAGTYVFMHFLHPKYFYQSHPFTIVPTSEKGVFRLYCKVLNGVTRSLETKALNNGGECETRVWVEGPYGVEFSTKPFKEIVLMAGGIGVTAVYSHLEHIVKSSDSQIIHVHWAISNSDPLSWFKKELDEMLSHSNTHVIIHLNGSQAPLPTTTSIHSGASDTPEKVISTTTSPDNKNEVSSSETSVTGLHIQKVWICPDYNKLIGDHITNSQGDIVFFVCGPAPMSDAVRAAVSNKMFNSRHYVQFYEESFSM